MREPASLDPRTKISHHTNTIVLGTEAEVEDHDLHHQGTTIVHDTKEANDPNFQGTHMITRMMKKRWGRHDS
jgi:serine acetyltransferase